MTFNESLDPRVTQFYQEQSEQTVALHIRGDLDSISEAQFNLHYAQIVENPEIAIIELDLTLIDFVDSKGLRQLIDAKRDAVEKNKRLIIKNASTGILRIIDITGLSDNFEFDPPIRRD